MNSISTLNPAYPPLSTLTGIIVHRGIKSMLDAAYGGQGQGLELVDYVQAALDAHEWEPGTTGPREQVMRELEFIGFAW